MHLKHSFRTKWFVIYVKNSKKDKYILFIFCSFLSYVRRSIRNLQARKISDREGSFETSAMMNEDDKETARFKTEQNVLLAQITDITPQI